MDVLILVPPFFRLMGSHNNKIGPSVQSVALMLRDLRGLDVKVYNADSVPHMDAYGDWGAIHDSSGDFEMYSEQERFPIYEEVLRTIAFYQPKCVLMALGDYAIPTVDLGADEVAVKLAERFHRNREWFPQTKLLGMGPTFTKNPVLAERFDGGIFGLPEAAWDAFDPDAEMQAYSCVRTPFDLLDRIPLFDESILLTPVRPGNYDMVMMSRRCDYARCSYCFEANLPDPCPVYSSPERLYMEVAHKKREYGLESFYMADLNFPAWGRENVDRFCRLVEPLNVTWTIETRADRVEPDLFARMQDAGLRTVKLGVEGGSDRILRAYRKGLSFRQQVQAAREIQALDLKLVCFVLLGHPDVADEDYREALPAMASIEADYYVTNLTCPYPGTEIFDRVEERAVELGLFRNGTSRGMTHLSSRLLELWDLRPETFEAYLNLSRSTRKEDAKPCQRMYLPRSAS